ncbi:MAG: hypothetical protein K8I02_11700 [Candidatus Methylomirabilis sp.]|nr:hypothetical protein [Deltaproteobacteria bacterium]
MDAPKGFGALGSQRNAIIAAVAAVAIPLSLFIYVDQAKKSRALNEVEQNLVRAEQATEQKDYVKGRDFLDRGAALHLSLKFRNNRWERLAERIKVLEDRIADEEAPHNYGVFLETARKHLEAGDYKKAEETLKNAKDTATLNKLYDPPFRMSDEEYEALRVQVDRGLKRLRLKTLARDIVESYEKKRFSQTWDAVREADALGLGDDREGDEEYRKAREEYNRVGSALRALLQEKKDQGFILVDENWVPIRDHALNRVRYMREYGIEVNAPKDDAAIIKDTIDRVFAVIAPGLKLVPIAPAEPVEEMKKPDIVLQVRDVSVETGPGGTWKSSAVFQFFEPRQDVIIWRLRPNVNSDAYRGPIEPEADARTNGLKSLVKDVFYKDFFRDLPGELRKKTNQDYANIQRP